LVKLTDLGRRRMATFQDWRPIAKTDDGEDGQAGI